MNRSNFIKKNTGRKILNRLGPVLLLIGLFSCTKSKELTPLLRTATVQPKCGVITMRPYLDSFIYPTFYITTFVHFAEGDEVIHVHGDVSGEHDSSWYFKKYDKDSCYCK